MAREDEPRGRGEEERGVAGPPPGRDGEGTHAPLLRHAAWVAAIAGALALIYRCVPS